MWAPNALVLVLASTATAQYKGFNYGATEANKTCRFGAAFEQYFNDAKTLPGAEGFTAARLYTNVQCETKDTPISAFQAAINTNTSLLLGLWASSGKNIIEDELNALGNATEALGAAFANLVIGISVGSEDLYRNSDVGKQKGSDPGATPDEMVSYIDMTRAKLSGTLLEGKPIGHVDTWTAWVLEDTKPVIEKLDWLGHNSFPWYETELENNSIDMAHENFKVALERTTNAATGKPVWVTETGWARVGLDSGKAIASPENAKRYWDEVGCELFGNTSTFWYTLKDANTAQTDLSFAITPLETNEPYFDLTCPEKEQEVSYV